MSAIDHPAAPGEAACLYQDGSEAPGPAVKNGTNLETSLVIVQPEALLLWHRQGFKPFWKYKSRVASLNPRLSQETSPCDLGDGKGQCVGEQSGLVVNF